MGTAARKAIVRGLQAMNNDAESRKKSRRTRQDSSKRNAPVTPADTSVFELSAQKARLEV